MDYKAMRDKGRLVQIELSDRKCGTCRLCCKLLAVGKDGVDDFKKPQGKWCKHCFDGGCRIYAYRPPDCEEYECTWLRGVFDDDDRPDKSRVVVSLEKGDSVYDNAGREIMPPQPVWCVYENTPGVTRRGRAKKIVEELERLLVMDEPGEYSGPFAICVIPSATGTRMVKFPGSKRWMPLLRPGEPDPQITPPLKQR